MAIKHNQKLISTHLRKDWQRRVRCHFDQPGAKVRRRDARRAKAAAVAPRPVDLLRPIVRCPTIKHNRRARAGRGFSLEELKAAGVPRLYAPTIGIAVDHRRQNVSEESLAANVARLKEYLNRVIVLPRRSNAPKKGDTKADLSKVDLVSSLASAIPIVSSDKTIKEISKADLPKAVEGGAFRKLRLARSDARLAGVREKRIRDKAEAEAAKK